MAKAWDIAGYTYRADTYCPECIVVALVQAGEASPAGYDMRAEDLLDQIAGANAIDRGDERSFDSGDFPKVIFESDVEDDICAGCGDPLI